MSAEESLRLAADVHKHVRRKMRDSNIISPGTPLIDIANFIETETKEYTAILLDSLNAGGKHSGMNSKTTTINGGIGFPVGLSVNNCAAHYHPHSSDTDKILSNSDILKVDFGTEINGWIVDSAFTTRVSGPPAKTVNSTPTPLKSISPHSFTDDDCDSLIFCMKEATETGIRNIGIDGSLSDWSASIEEVIRSYDNVYPIYNLTGHDIKHEIIHGDVRLPSVRSAVDNENERFKAGVYAIETFGAKFGKGSRRESYIPETKCAEVDDLGESTIFRLNPELARYSVQELQTRFRTPIFRIQSVQKAFSQICKRFRTLPFAERYLQPSDKTPLSLLVKNGVVMNYPPLCIDPGSITAQFEHTVLLKDAGGAATVFSRDDDY
jgi:methionyl aminopeptidase